MAEHYLATYLNDHMAGARAALDLLDHLEGAQAGSPVAHVAAELKAEIEADRRVLESLMERLQISVSRPRKAAAWLAEKMTELKLNLDDRSGGPLRQLEDLEGLSLGIEGKRLLWRALRTAAERAPKLGGTDYEGLERRAEEQRSRVEVVRLETAKLALGSNPSTPPTMGADSPAKSPKPRVNPLFKESSDSSCAVPPEAGTKASLALEGIS